MEILQLQSPDTLTLQISGRLDAYWAEHLSAALDQALRAGARRVLLDMSQVPFMSSVGIRVLVRFYKQLQRIDGSLAVINPSVAVRNVLQLSGLLSLLSESGPTAAAAPSAARPAATLRHGCRFEIFPLDSDARIGCRLIGDIAPMHRAAYGGPSHRVRCEAASFGLGVGAFGTDFDDCRERFGEMLFAGGAAIYLPTDGSNMPDYLVHTAAMIPEVEALYMIRCAGRFAHLLRFDASAGGDDAAADDNAGGGQITLGNLIEAGFTFAQSEQIAWVMIAESAGLVGAALRHAPTSRCASIFDHPGVRDWLSFTPERAFNPGVALITGVARRGAMTSESPLAGAYMAYGNDIRAHVHAAAFTYHPLPSGLLDLESSVADLCVRHQLLGVLHLLDDDRPIAGAGDSELVRGAMWIAPAFEEPA